MGFEDFDKLDGQMIDTKGKKWYLLVILVIAILIFINVKFQLFHKIFSPEFRSESAMASAMEGIWSNSKKRPTEVIIEGSDVYYYFYAKDSSENPTVRKLVYRVDNYRLGTFTLYDKNGNRQFNGELTKEGVLTCYSELKKVSESTLVTIAVPEKEMTEAEREAAIRRTQQEIDRLNGKTNNSTQTNTLSSEDLTLYWTIAQKEVKSRLKSPSTAKFPFAANSEGVTITKAGDIVTVNSYVDA